jgi:hypothetical protein
MRKVLYKKWIPKVSIPTTLPFDDDTEPGTGCLSDFIHEGLFHQWGVSSDDIPGSGGEAMGIIENTDGTISIVYPQNIKFIS